jgi:primosomal protein N' (replication factor Y)
LPAGTEVTGELTAPRVKIKTRTYAALADDAGGRDELRGAKQLAILETLERFDADGRSEVGASELLDAADATRSSLNRLADLGFVVLSEREVIRTPFGFADTGPVSTRVDLYPAQRAALAEIWDAVDARKPETFLLHGITGSGKTEIYIAAIEPVLERGQSAIVLVPEISLTPQTVSRFRGRLGDRVAVMHSRMSAGERFDAWRKLAAGDFKVVIGPRSAILAPVQDIGLIVVDEEHEPSYKQFDPAPRYHARDVAVMRAHRNGAVCVLGSATPSLESHHNAIRGKYRLLSLPERAPTAAGEPAKLPRVRRVDLSKEYMKGKLTGNFSDLLRDSILQRLDRQEQVMLLLNRRGYAPVLECQACGWSPSCRDCAVAMTMHARRRHLRCHYCGYATAVPSKCPECGEKELALLGTGTQRLEDEVAELFRDARVLRMDLDTTSRKDAHFKILKQFGAGEADILLGTQMIAKGLDFPNVTLVGIVNADSRLLMPDFRAAEHTFHLLAQVSGRAGRADKPGEVILQTRNPRHDVIQRACSHDFSGFAEQELLERNQLQYPPFGRVIALEFKGPDEKIVERLAHRFTEAFRAAGPRGVTVLGPEAPFLSRLKKNYRFQTILKLGVRSDPTSVKSLLTNVEYSTKIPAKTRVVVDVDPVNLL